MRQTTHILAYSGTNTAFVFAAVLACVQTSSQRCLTLESARRAPVPGTTALQFAATPWARGARGDKQGPQPAQLP